MTNTLINWIYYLNDILIIFLIIFSNLYKNVGDSLTFSFPGIFLYGKSHKGSTRPVNPVAEAIINRYRIPGQVKLKLNEIPSINHSISSVFSQKVIKMILPKSNCPLLSRLHPPQKMYSGGPTCARLTRLLSACKRRSLPTRSVKHSVTSPGGFPNADGLVQNDQKPGDVICERSPIITFPS